MIIFILIFIGLFAISILINVFQFRKNQRLLEIARRDTEIIKKSKENLERLAEYQKIISYIQNKESEIHNKIKEASTDEEVNNIIRNILNDNNSMFNG